MLVCHCEQLKQGLKIEQMLNESGVCLQGEQWIPLDIQDCDTDIAQQDEHHVYPHWELLERKPVFANGPSLAVRHVSSPASRQSAMSIETADSFNILLVTSRKKKKSVDIQPRLISMPLYSLVSGIPRSRVWIDIMRPDTFESFKQYLAQKKYNLVHFDLHGNVDSRTGDSVLIFAGIPIRGSTVAEELKRVGIKFVVLNACRSAHPSQDRHTNANLAKTLVQSGVGTVIGMVYSITPEAVIEFLNHFYKSLLLEGRDVLYSIRSGRAALRTKQIRKVKFGWRVPIEDHILPVLYQSDPTDVRLRFADTLNHVKVNNALAQPPALEWRDYDVHAIEKLLSKSHTVCLSGSPGVGKATLVRHLRWWWQATSFISKSIALDFFDCSPSDLSQSGFVRDKLSSQLCELNSSLFPEVVRDDTSLCRLLEGQNCLVLLENIDWIRRHDTNAEVIEQEINTLLSSLKDLSPPCLVLISTSSLQLSWLDRAPDRYELGPLDPYSATQLAAKMIGWDDSSENAPTGESRWLERVLQTISFHPAAIRSLLPPAYKAAGSCAELFRRLHIGATEDAWELQTTVRVRRQFEYASKTLGPLVSIFAAVQRNCSRGYLKQQLAANKCASEGGLEESKGKSKVDQLEDILGVLKECGIGREASQHQGGTLEAVDIHPLFCHYLRRFVCTPAQQALAFSNLVLHTHNVCQEFIDQPLFTPAMNEALHVEWFPMITSLYSLTQKCAGIATVDRCFDLPWIFAALRVHQRSLWQLADEEEVIADITLRGLRCVLPELKLSSNYAWKIQARIYLTNRLQRLSQPDNWLVLLMLQWLVVYWYDLSRHVARTFNGYMMQLLDTVSVVNNGQGGSFHGLEGFFKCIGYLFATELGVMDDTWHLEEYLPIWRALQMSDIFPDHLHQRFLQTWDQDLRFRLNHLQASLDVRIQELLPGKIDRLGAVGQISEERSQALDDDCNMIEVVQRPAQFENKVAHFHAALQKASVRHDTRRIRHLLKCLIRVSLLSLKQVLVKKKILLTCRKILNSYGDSVGTLHVLKRLAATQDELENMPGYVESQFAENEFERWTLSIQMDCTERLRWSGANDTARRQRAVMGRLLEVREANWTTEDMQAEERQQKRAILRERLEKFQDGKALRDAGGFYDIRSMAGKSISPDELASWPEYQRVAFEGLDPSRLKGLKRILPSKPQPPSDLYLSRPFAVVAQWLSAAWYLDMAAGNGAGGGGKQPHTPSVKFERRSTPLDVYLLAEHLRHAQPVDLARPSTSPWEFPAIAPDWYQSNLEPETEVARAVEAWYEDIRKCDEMRQEVNDAREEYIRQRDNQMKS
ncbi:uncharacterized protein TrAFT101_011111 [Trichoderma asperellum]|uniref:uncharacterized protein n=1 Tax=Trichoderma asperellum TaxID=101201 RepID=UPI00332FDD92|nr:hypothetical protein TrAFT101_011111 [Trichoderma asperellum]